MRFLFIYTSSREFLPDLDLRKNCGTIYAERIVCYFKVAYKKNGLKI